MADETATPAPVHVPHRRCRVCRQSRAKRQLQRWVRRPAGPLADPEQKLPGRGFYSCSDNCAAKLAHIMRRAPR